MCVLGRDSSSCGHAGGGGGDPRERLQFFTSPSKSVCSSRCGQGCCSPVFHTIHNRLLSSAGSTAAPPRPGSVPGPHKVDTDMHTPLLPLPKDKKPGLGCNLKPTTDTKLFSRLQKLEAMDATTFTERLFLH